MLGQSHTIMATALRRREDGQAPPAPPQAPLTYTLIATNLEMQDAQSS